MLPLTVVPKTLLCFGVLSFASHVPTTFTAKAQAIEVHKGCATLSAPGKYPDYEPMPKYSVERKEPLSPSGNGLLLGVSVPPDAINSGSLTRLACKLGSDFPDQKKVEAYIFDDEKAARNLAIYYTEQRGYGVYLWHFKARYTLDRTERLEFVEFVFPTLEDGLLSVRRVKVWLGRSETANPHGPGEH